MLPYKAGIFFPFFSGPDRLGFWFLGGQYGSLNILGWGVLKECPVGDKDGKTGPAAKA